MRQRSRISTKKREGIIMSEEINQLTVYEQIEKNKKEIANMQTHLDLLAVHLKEHVDFVVHSQHLPFQTLMDRHKKMAEIGACMNWLIGLVNAKNMWNEQHKDKGIIKPLGDA